MEYACAGGKLKLKKSLKPKGKKRTKKPRDPNVQEIPKEQSHVGEKRSDEEEDQVKAPKKIGLDGRTKAEVRFELARHKRMSDKLSKKNELLKTHKQRVEEFNEKLEKLTEYNDIPKVSWTK